MLETEKAEWTTAYVNSLPDAAFALIEPAYKRGETEDKRARHLPHHTSGVTDPNDDDTVDLPHLRNALARANQIQPITDSISAEEARRQALAHLQAHAKRLGVGEVAKLEKIVPIRKADGKKHIVYGEVYVPGDPNHRDAHGHWMTAEEIEKMAHAFMANLRIYNVDKQHDGKPGVGIIVESFIAREGDPDFAPGAWVVATKVLDDSVWEKIERGEISGYSMAGVAEIVPDEEVK